MRYQLFDIIIMVLNSQNEKNMTLKIKIRQLFHNYHS